MIPVWLVFYFMPDVQDFCCYALVQSWYHTGWPGQNSDVGWGWEAKKVMMRSVKLWSHLRDFSCRGDHHANADAITFFYTIYNQETPWMTVRFDVISADEITILRLHYMRRSVLDITKFKVHDGICSCKKLWHPLLYVVTTKLCYFRCISITSLVIVALEKLWWL
jgi:hypothetical protein